MQVKLLSLIIPLPGRAVPSRNPIIWWITVRARLRVLPNVEILESCLTLDTFLEPLMLVTRVIGHKVKYNTKLEGLGFRYQPPEIVQRSKTRVDIGKIGNIVPEIGHR
uniref:Uncharacterized protein n=1 Tax=Anopheles atroparvus TaxID=41427 RepID=A0AAG5DWR5_ANOAO